MRLSDFDYELPLERIAQAPTSSRDSSRLLTFDRASGEVQHRIFRELPDILLSGDVLVINDTKVIPARLQTKEGREVFLAKSLSSPPLVGGVRRRCPPSQSPPQGGRSKTVWECLVRGGKHFLAGAEFEIGDDLMGTVLEVLDSGERVIEFESANFETALKKYGTTPLPPYITPPPDPLPGGVGVDKRYQTVYAQSTKSGSVAAPTAGLHFTPELFTRLREKGIQVARVTLHVGLGTFQPVQVEQIIDHKMHSEFYELSVGVTERLNQAKSEGRRIIAVGTTSCRVLESCSDESGKLTSGIGETDIFIYPGYEFHCIDSLITNFHLPKSTLLMLVSALIGREKTFELYKLAKKEKYRFYSFGDAMLLL